VLALVFITSIGALYPNHVKAVVIIIKLMEFRLTITLANASLQLFGIPQPNSVVVLQTQLILAILALYVINALILKIYQMIKNHVFVLIITFGLMILALFARV